jgi:hypothetical protein
LNRCCHFYPIESNNNLRSSGKKCDNCPFVSTTPRYTGGVFLLQSGRGHNHLFIFFNKKLYGTAFTDKRYSNKRYAWYEQGKEKRFTS